MNQISYINTLAPALDCIKIWSTYKRNFLFLVPQNLLVGAYISSLQVFHEENESLHLITQYVNQIHLTLLKLLC